MVLTCLVLILGAATETEETVPPFIPTHEWQTILPGQSVPPGLHIRVNMQTGEKVAKLLDPQPATQGSALVAVESPVGASAEGSAEGSGSAQSSQSSQDSPLPNYKLEDIMRLRELAKQLFQPVDYEQLISDALGYIQSSNSTEEQVVRALMLLEDIAHQYDHAINIVTMGGMESILEVLKRPFVSSKLLYYAAWVVGTAAQNNGKVQSSLLELGAFESLVRLLNETESPKNWHLLHPESAPSGAAKAVTAAAVAAGAAGAADEHDNSNIILEEPAPSLLEDDDQPQEVISGGDGLWKVQSKLLYAISSLLRGFPQGSASLDQVGGTWAIRAHLVAEPLPADTPAQQLRAEAKWLGLLEDLVADEEANPKAVVSSWFCEVYPAMLLRAANHPNLLEHSVEIFRNAWKPSEDAVGVEGTTSSAGSWSCLRSPEVAALLSRALQTAAMLHPEAKADGGRDVADHHGRRHHDVDYVAATLHQLVSLATDLLNLPSNSNIHGSDHSK